MSDNKLVHAFKYLVAYQHTLEENIKEIKEDLYFFDGSFKESVEKYIKDKEKELEDLKILIENWL